jgi:hypothetical protein
MIIFLLLLILHRVYLELIIAREFFLGRNSFWLLLGLGVVDWLLKVLLLGILLLRVEIHRDHILRVHHHGLGRHHLLGHHLLGLHHVSREHALRVHGLSSCHHGGLLIDGLGVGVVHGLRDRGNLRHHLRHLNVHGSHLLDRLGSHGLHHWLRVDHLRGWRLLELLAHVLLNILGPIMLFDTLFLLVWVVRRRRRVVLVK